MRPRSPFHLVVLLLLGCAGCADLVLPPAPAHYTAPQTTAYLFTRDGLTLEAYVARSTGADKTAQPAAYVLRFTGGDASGQAAFTASRWKSHSTEVWVVNYPGYGQSAGPRNLGALARAATASYDELRQKAGERPIFVEGFSLGTVPALCVAARRPVAGLILQNPLSLKQTLMGHYGWWNAWLVAVPMSATVTPEFDSLANAAAAKAPAVFVCAEDDQTIPLRFQQQIFDVYAGPKRMLLQKDAGHWEVLNEVEEAELQVHIDWLWKSVRAK